MTQFVSRAVAKGITEIKASRRCNMSDIDTVIKVALDIGNDELAQFIEHNESSYRACLAHGFLVREDAPTNLPGFTSHPGDGVIEEVFNTCSGESLEEDVEIQESGD